MTNFLFDKMGQLINFINKTSWLTSSISAHSIGSSMWNWPLSELIIIVLNLCLLLIILIPLVLLTMVLLSLPRCSSFWFLIWVIYATIRSPTLRCFFRLLSNIAISRSWCSYIEILCLIDYLWCINHSNFLIPLTQFSSTLLLFELFELLFHASFLKFVSISSNILFYKFIHSLLVWFVKGTGLRLLDLLYIICSFRLWISHFIAGGNSLLVLVVTRRLPLWINRHCVLQLGVISQGL